MTATKCQEISQAPICFNIRFCLLLLVFTALAWAETKIVYPAFESPTDTRFNDLVEILQTA